MTPSEKKCRKVNCVECGGAMTTARENYKYDISGLRHVTLMGIWISRCAACGNYEVSISRIEDLHRLIAKCVIEKETRFTGMEVRFLRKILGLTAIDFARRMGVTVETVSRWENDATAIGTQADRFLRLLVALGELTTKYPAEKLDLIDSDSVRDTRLVVRFGGREWAVEACA